MRRWIAFFCLIALLFTACAADSSYQNDDADPPKATAASVPPFTVSGPTAGGIKVYMDSSKYSASRPGDIYTRLGDGFLDRFHPAADYGTVYPYPANILYSSAEGGYSWRAGYKYGLFDRSGRILTDGIYLDVTPMASYRNSSVPVYLPLWLVSRVSDVTVTHEESEYGGWDRIDGETLYGVVAMDGSFAIPCNYRYVEAMEDCLIAYRSYGTPDFVVFDLEGNILFTSADLNLPSSDWYSCQYSEGLLMINLHRAEEDSEVYYYDLNGTQVLGPYANASAFSEGLACVSADGSRYGYIDHSGSWVISPEYSSSYASFRDGRTIQTKIGGTNVVIDTKGSVLLSVSGKSLALCECGFYTPDYSGTVSNTQFYDRDGTLLFSGTGEWNCLDETTFFQISEAGISRPASIRIHRLEHPDEDIILSSETTIYASISYQDGRLLHGYTVSNYETDNAMFYTKDFKTSYEIKSTVPDTYESYYYGNQAVNDALDGTPYYVVFDGANCHLFDGEDNHLMAFATTSVPKIYGGIVCALDATSYTCRDLTGKVIFRYSFNTED